MIATTEVRNAPVRTTSLMCGRQASHGAPHRQWSLGAGDSTERSLGRSRPRQALVILENHSRGICAHVSVYTSPSEAPRLGEAARLNVAGVSFDVTVGGLTPRPPRPESDIRDSVHCPAVSVGRTVEPTRFDFTFISAGRLRISSVPCLSRCRA